MRTILTVLCVITILSVSTVSMAFAADETSGVLPGTMEKYKIAREKVEVLAGTATAQRAPEVVAEAGKSIAAAQDGLKAGNDKLTQEFVEKALLQINLANALAVERSAEEKTAAARVELEKLERRLTDILAGKGGN